MPPTSPWFEDSGFELVEEPPNLCTCARAFSAWAEALCANVESSPSHWALNRAKLVLAERYFEWYAIVPKRHREAVRDHGHRCIFPVFREAWFRLRQLQLTVDPPVFEPPLPPPLPPPPAQIAGILLAEHDEEG